MIISLLPPPSITALQQPVNTTLRLENQLKCDFCEGPSVVALAIRQCCHLPQCKVVLFAEAAVVHLIIKR